MSEPKITAWVGHSGVTGILFWTRSVGAFEMLVTAPDDCNAYWFLSYKGKTIEHGAVPAWDQSSGEIVVAQQRVEDVARAAGIAVPPSSEAA